MDIDNFKQINDGLGHSTGNALLHLVAETIRKNVRAVDIIARLGGDEFAILMPETGYEQSGIVINKVQKYLLDAVEERGWPVTFSFGVVTCNNPLCKVDELIKAADNLMYSVKNSGKNMTRHEVLDRVESACI
jgi:diguanylate cyclase (GGDEF)-like protein